MKHLFFWQHQFQPVSTQQRFEPWVDRLAGQHEYFLKLGLHTGAYKTDVLDRCGCGALRTRTLKGNWSMADITGVKPSLEVKSDEKIRAASQESTPKNTPIQ